MPEDILNDGAPLIPEGNVPDNIPAEPAPVDYESAARAEGWKSKEELGDAFDPGRHVNAEEFIKRKPLFETIKQQSKAIKELKKTVDSVVQFSKQNAELEVKRAIDALNAQKREAISLGDVETVERIDKSIKLHEESAKKAVEPSVPPEVVEWTANNEWFDADMEMQDFATAYCASYAKRRPNDSITAALEATEKAVRKAFPDSRYFSSSRKDYVSPVETRTGETPPSPKGASKYQMSRLNEDQKRTYDAYVKKGKMMTHDQYFTKLEEIGALEK